MFEKEAEEYYYKTYPVTLNLGEEERKKEVTDIFIKGAVFGYNKANEWHYVKDGLPEETKKYFIYSKEWGVELRKFFADVGYFECRKNDVIAWKEIVLPKEEE